MNSAVILAALALCLPAGATEFFVAPNGNDSSPGTKTAPFASITRARDAVRALKARAPLRAAVHIVLRGGTYYLPQTVVLEPRDSGLPGAPIIYRAETGERVVLSGGTPIPGPWTPSPDGVWSAPLPPGPPQWIFRQLFVNGRREIRARFPNAGAKPAFLFAAGGTKESILIDRSAPQPNWDSAIGAEVNIVPEWRFFNQIQSIRAFHPSSATLQLGGEEPHARITPGSWFFLEGSRAELDQSREWFLDHRARRLYYLPEPGQNPNLLQFVAPRLPAIFLLQGNPESASQVQFVHLQNLEFHHTTNSLGHIEARVQTDAALVLTNASHSRIEGCRFHNIGGYAIWLHLDSSDNVLDRNEISEAGAGGVLLTSARFSYMDDSKLFTTAPAAANAAPLRNRITRNHIHHCGRLRYYSSAVHLDSRPAETAMMAGNYIAFNHMHHLSRNGIFAFRNQGGNIFEFNRIEEIMNDTEDGGAIHVATMNQLAAPNIARNNLIANVWGWRQLPDGGKERHIARGVYLDWFSASTLVENNIVFNTLSGGLQFNAGDDNHFLNNVVVGDRKAWNIHWQNANALGTRDERNLIIPDPAADSPLRNPALGDFSLRQDFPSYPAGFHWIDVSRIGPNSAPPPADPLARMARQGGVLHYDQPGLAVLTGPWRKETGTGFWGLFTFKFVAAPAGSNATAAFSLPIPQDGLYDLRLSFPALPGNAPDARFEVLHAGGTSVESVDMKNFGYWRRLGTYRFRAGQPARVLLHSAGASGQVVLEAIGFVRIGE